MINLLDIKEDGERKVVEALARLERNPDFKLVLTKLRRERETVKNHCVECADIDSLRQHQGGGQVLNDIIGASEKARDLLS